MVNIRTVEKESQIFCEVRRKWMVYQPEELVRQLILHYLLSDQRIRKPSIIVEKNTGLKNKDRIDIAVQGEGGKPFLLIECKAWTETINQKVLNQIGRYNNQLKYPYCWLSNGKENFLFEYNKEGSTYAQIAEFPKGYS